MTNQESRRIASAKFRRSKKGKVYQRKWRLDNKEKIKIKQAEWQRGAGKEIHKRAILKYRYGITPEDKKKLLKSQKYSCAICKTHQNKLIRGLFIDHCHSTKKVRGLLCSLCNTFLGKVDKNQRIIQNLIQYIKI